MKKIKKKLNGQQRIVIEHVCPEIDCGRFAIKRCINDRVVVEVTVFAEGHDELVVELHYRNQDEQDWLVKQFQPLGNDRWQCEFIVSELGLYHYTISAWVDHFTSWRRDLFNWLESKEDVFTHLLYGAQMLEQAAAFAGDSEDGAKLQSYAASLKSADIKSAMSLVKDTALADLFNKYADKQIQFYGKELSVIVDRLKARFSAWYELFPRSLGKQGQHGTFQDVIEQLPYIAELGFDVLYIPPIHPIGSSYRKGKNNSLTAQADDCGSPWAIGSEAGGHKAIHAQLGSLKEFQDLIKAAKNYGIEIALDIALQCSPEHPYVTQHPQWFQHRPDGSIQYAQNPPKKYQDIYPLYFQSEDWQNLWNEIIDVLRYWIKQGVQIFRVDNPHTKPFVFWEYLIAQIKVRHPEVIFLSEAFTRPNIMYYLAKLGFTQSYTYFTWRNSKAELISYFTELSQSPVREFFRPNLWPNTPDILPKFLQEGGRNGFAIRFLLAATLGANYGIYGPVFELAINAPREPESEEYLDSEKYELRSWDLDHSLSLRNLISLMNKIRRDYTCLQQDWELNFHTLDNEYLLAYSKCDDRNGSILLIIVNVDPNETQSGWLELNLDCWGQVLPKQYWVQDLLTGHRYEWYGQRNYIELNPHELPGHIFSLEL